MDEKKIEEKKEEVVTVESLQTENDALKKEIEKLKTANTNASADAAKHKRSAEEWKEKYRSTQDEATRKEAERAEADEALKQELDALRTEKRISTYTAKLMESGYDAQTATSMAMNLPEGISDDFFATQKTFLDNQKQLAKTEALNNQPSLSVGVPPTSPSKEDTDLRKWMGLPTK